MNNKLDIFARDVPLALDSDFSISLELKNPIFNENEMFSLPVALPIEPNRHVLKNIDDLSSCIRPVDYEHTPMRIVADGITVAHGMAIVQEDERLENTFSMNVDASAQSFTDLIGDLKCNEVPIPSKYHEKLIIGEKIDEVNVCIKYHTNVVIKYQGKKGDKKQGSVGSYNTVGTFSPQALGFSYPALCEEYQQNCIAVEKEVRIYSDGTKVKIPSVKKSYINVSEPYPTMPYCNARVCYAHHDINDDGTTSSNIVEWGKQIEKGEMYENKGPVWALEADRPQSGICFYILFFLDCLFEHLGVQFDNSALKAVGDFRRLCFFTTKCAYDTKPLHYGSLFREEDEEVISGKKAVGDIKDGFFHKIADNEKEAKDIFSAVNEWLDSRGCGGNLSIENPKEKSVQHIKYYPVTFRINDVKDYRFPNSVLKMSEAVTVDEKNVQEATVGTGGVASITTKSEITGAEMSASIVSMYANEKNFPDESVSDVINSLEQQFGIKFYYDYEQKKVTAYLLRDVFREQNAEPRTLHAEITAMQSISEKITGVRACYSSESESKEQRDNVKNKVKDYNTDYDYIDYGEKSTVTNLTYREIIQQVYNNQMNVFIDLHTGNKYRVKIDSDFSDANQMNPRLFEVGAYKGVEVGDCSTLNEDYVVEMASDFVPVPMVDINYRKALSAYFDNLCVSDVDVQPTSGNNLPGYMVTEINGSNAETVMAAFIDEDMEHEFVKQYIKNPLSSAVADFYVTEELSLRESYNPSDTDDGNSPLQSYDWGLSIAIMRGGGVDSSHESYDYNYDGFGNSKWRTTVGQYALTTDSIDCYGNEYDYNGNEPGIGNEERFSLKPRAWVQPEWASSPLVVNKPEVKNRGYVDTFLTDYIYFLLNRKKYYVQCLTSVAQLVDIQNHWKDWWVINGKKCIIDKVNTDISVDNGLGMVELEVYCL